MEIPVINRIGEFDIGITSITDPSIFTQIFAVSEIGKLHLVYSFWKWGALIIAFLASFTTLIDRIKLLLLRLRKIDTSVALLNTHDDCDSEPDVSCSSSDEDQDEEEDTEEEEDDSKSNWRRVNEDFRVRGSVFDLDERQGQTSNFNIRRRRNGVFTELPSFEGMQSSCVVKLWEHLDYRNDVASYIERCRVIESSPSVVLTAEKFRSDGVEVKAWDTRAGFRVPALLAEWSHPSKLLGKFIAVETGLSEKLFFRDDVSGEVTVRDMRKVNGTLTDLTEYEVNTWWDADGVSVPDLPLTRQCCVTNWRLGQL